MKKIYLVDENLNEFAKRGRKRKVREPEDSWYGSDEFDTAEPSGPEQIEDVELEDEVTDVALNRQIVKMLNNELKISEFNRGALRFKNRKTGEFVDGIPMAALSKGEAYLFKTDAGLKKVKINDIVLESENTDKKIFVSESWKDYINE